ncbi:MAG TPA: hypothetical protein VF219_14110 [Vicinamibacterales bacterium]
MSRIAQRGSRSAQVTAVEIKDITLPENMQRAMANSTIIFPAQFMTTVQEAINMIRGDGAR